MEQTKDLLATLLTLEKEKNIPQIEKLLNDDSYKNNPAMEYYIAHCYYVGFIYEKNLDEAIQHLKNSATNRYASACFMLSNLFENGEGVVRDLDIANEYLQQASDSGYLPAINKLGEVYLVGRSNIAKDEAKAFELFSIGNEKCFRKSTINYAHCLFYGLGTNVNVEEAMQIVTKLIKEYDDVDAYYELGLAHYNGATGKKDAIRSTYNLLEAASRGHAKASKLLGDCYYDGFGVRIDHQTAYRYYKFAADKGDAEAATIAANCLVYGDGVASNFKEAVSYTVKAAENGDSEAAVTLGNRYYYGDGFRRNYSRAAHWYQIAANANNPSGLKNFADMLEEGKGIKKNISRAVEMYTKAIELNNFNACVALAEIYSHGRKGFARDYEKALFYYEMAYRELDDEYAAFEYAQLLSSGKGVKVADYTKAARAYEFAAKKGYEPAIKITGEYYLKGIGVARDYEKALRYYLEAAKRGDQEAAILVSLIRRSMEFSM